MNNLNNDKLSIYSLNKINEQNIKKINEFEKYKER